MPISKVQPPYLQSSGPPGSSMTPSTETNSVTDVRPIVLLMWCGPLPIVIQTVVQRAARARLEGVAGTRAVRRLVRGADGGGALVDRVDGRAAGRRMAGDDVRGPRAPRDPVEGRVPRGRRTGAARVYGLGPARR